ncbi:hypothetical protein HDU99_004406, partial [Rhizoclosmatium hyalinum]
LWIKMKQLLDNDPNAFNFRLEKSAEIIYGHYVTQIAHLIQGTENRKVQAAYGKTKGAVVRFAAVIETMAKVLGNEPWSPVITKISILGAIKIVGVLMDVKMCWLGKEKARAIEDLFAWNRKSFFDWIQKRLDATGMSKTAFTNRDLQLNKVIKSTTTVYANVDGIKSFLNELQKQLPKSQLIIKPKTMEWNNDVGEEDYDEDVVPSSVSCSQSL